MRIILILLGYLFCRFDYLNNFSFIRINRMYWSNYMPKKIDDRGVVLAELNNNIFGAYGTAVLANLLASKHDSRIIYLNYKKPPKKLVPAELLDLRAVLRLKWLRDSFSKNTCISVFDITNQSKANIKEKADEIYRKINVPEDILDLSYNGLYVGDLIYDQAMREGAWQATIWKIDQRVYKTIYQAVAILETLEYIAKHYDVKAATCSHIIGYVGLIPRYFAARNIECVTGIAGAGPIRKHWSFNGKRLPTEVLIPKRMMDSILSDNKIKTSLLEKANDYILQRMSGGFSDLDSKRAFAKQKKEYHSASAFCRAYHIDPAKKCVFVMLHAFNDFPHHYENNIFRDYYIWFKETLEIAKSNSSVNWIFKEHPSSEYYPCDVDLKEIFANVNESHIVFLDRNENFNSSSLRQIAHALVTCIGTAGLEFACHGVPSVIAGENHYSGLGICYEPKDYGEYRELLINISALSPISKEIQNIAKILFYIQYNYLFGSNSNNDVFLPRSSHEEKMRNDYKSVLKYIAKNLESHDTSKKINDLMEYIEDDKRGIYFRDEYLANIEKSIN